MNIFWLVIMVTAVLTIAMFLLIAKKWQRQIPMSVFWSVLIFATTGLALWLGQVGVCHRKACFIEYTRESQPTIYWIVVAVMSLVALVSLITGLRAIKTIKL